MRRERDAIRHAASFEQLRKVVVLGLNTMPAFIECSHAYAVLGEMMDVLRGVYEVYEESMAI